MTEPATTPSRRAATHGEVVAVGIASGQQMREPLTLTALFDDPDTVERALDALYSAGTPRDLVEVVVSRESAKLYSSARRTPRGPGRETFRYAGIGGLIGFILGVLVGIVLVAMPGIESAGGMAPVQLLGPNMATIGGAAIGAVFGYFCRQRPDPRFARAAEAARAIVLAVSTRSEHEASLLGDLLVAHGARDIQIEDRGLRAD
ncbi:hypothetical protein [Gemmatimonas sp.]|uniref:hypothetical protein n=1 Tax=Gemmatimonas sp. TaxID=1962908 RepID=UPI003565B6A0